MTPAARHGAVTGRQDSVARGGSQVHPDDVQALLPGTLEAFDHLATMVAVIEPDGQCLFANVAFEEELGLSRRSVLRESLFDWFEDATVLRDVVRAVAANEYATSRLEARLKRHPNVFA
jgi:two-component system nitrogen regulation sensor histidine kinase GlnL